MAFFDGDIEHGGNLMSAIAQYGGDESQWLDLSTGISPFTPELPELPVEVFRRLPDPHMLSAVESKAKAFYRSKMNCLAIAGSQFAIERLPYLLAGPVGIVEPTYGEYAHAFKRAGLSYEKISSVDALSDICSLILANPNNPDGRKYEASELLSISKKLKARGGTLVVDEAFAGFENHDSLLPIADALSNLVILRSVGKFFGLAGIRVGLVFAHDTYLSQLKAHVGPWTISGPALHLTDFVLSRPQLVDELRDKIMHRHDEMSKVFSDAALNVVGETPLYFLISHLRADLLHEHLLDNYIYTRKFDYEARWLRFGLTANRSEDQRLVNTLRSFRVSHG